MSYSEFKQKMLSGLSHVDDECEESMRSVVNEIDPKYYSNESYIATILQLSPDDRWGDDRIELLKIKPEFFEIPNLMQAAKALSEGLRRGIGLIAVALSEIDPKWYTNRAFIDAVIKLSKGNRNWKNHVDLLASLSKLDPEIFENPHLQDAAQQLSKELCEGIDKIIITLSEIDPNLYLNVFAGCRRKIVCNRL